MATIDQQLAALQSLMGQTNDQQIVENQTSKIDKKIASQQEKMNSELTGDEAVDSVITTPQSQRSPYQIATANLNPDLKSKNKRYQNAYNNLNVLENEKVNMGQAGQIMMDTYREAIESTNKAAERMMNANAAANALEVGSAISGSAGLAANPAAASNLRTKARNQLIAQNAQIRSNADQNIASLYSGMAQVPATLSSISATNAQIDVNRMNAEANADLVRAQANAYRNPSQTKYVSKTNSNDNDEDVVKKDYKDMDMNELLGQFMIVMGYDNENDVYGKLKDSNIREELKKKDPELYNALVNYKLG